MLRDKALHTITKWCFADLHILFLDNQNPYPVVLLNPFPDCENLRSLQTIRFRRLKSFLNSLQQY